jgi:hypothetical protein
MPNTTTTGGSGGISGGTANVTPTGFSVAVLQELKVPVNAWTVSVLNSIQKAEEPSLSAYSEYNPFNISGGQFVANQYNLGVNVTGTMNPGNGPAVDEFSGWADGVKATANWIKNADPGIYSALISLGQSSTATGTAGAQVGNDVANFFTAVTKSGSFGIDGSTGYSYWQQTYFPYFGGGQVSQIIPSGILGDLTSILLGPIGDIVGNPVNASGPNSGEPADISGSNLNPNPSNVGGSPSGGGPCWWSISYGGSNICLIANNPFSSDFLKRLGLGALGIIMILFGALMVLTNSIHIKIADLATLAPK